jgi:CGNR zinc finger
MAAPNDARLSAAAGCTPLRRRDTAGTVSATHSATGRAPDSTAACTSRNGTPRFCSVRCANQVNVTNHRVRRRLG